MGQSLSVSGRTTKSILGHESPSLRAMARRSFLGYGSLTNPHWFIGIEPGGDHGDLYYHAWAKAGYPDVIDSHLHHRLMNEVRFFGVRPVLNQTWAKLIRLHLSFIDNQPLTIDMVRYYQSTRWLRNRDRFRENGKYIFETTLINISGIQRPRVDADSIKEIASNYPRLKFIKSMIDAFKPKTVVFAGLLLQKEAEFITGSKFNTSGVVETPYTTCMLIKHPNARHTTNSYFSDKGLELRRLYDDKWSKCE